MKRSQGRQIFLKKTLLFKKKEMIFSRLKKAEAKTYDRKTQEPVIKASICNGEQVAGFRDIRTGRFEEILYVRKPSDLDAFKAEYGIEGEIKKEY